MRRAERLFEVVMLLRGRRRAITGKEIATRLEISLRSVYRDIRALELAGVPIEGEAGVGFRLRPGMDVPPLMFTHEELEALQLGAAMTGAWGDPRLAKAAASALERIEAVLPEHLRNRSRRRRLFVPDFFVAPEVKERALLLRSAIERGARVRIDYAGPHGRAADRVVEPLGLFYWGSKWTLAAWCTLRRGFRTFRLDRIEAAEELPGAACEHTLEEYLESST